jgi:Flp pilus assembly protein TadG
MVEFALIAPMMLLLVTGIFWFGIALNNSLVLTNAVAQGAQLVGVSRGTTTDPCATAVTAVQQAATGLTQSSLTYYLSVNGTSYTGTTCSSATLTAGEYVTLKVTYPVTVYLFAWAPKSFLMSASTTEIIE